MVENKLKGTFQFGANYEVTKADALDPRVRWDDWDEMIVKSNWPYNGDTVYLYNGLVASVGEELWMLVDASKFTQKLNTVGLKDLMYDNDLTPIYPTTKDVAEFLGWKVIGGNHISIDGHVLKIQK